MNTGHEDPAPGSGRRRKFAALCGGVAAVMVLGGLLLSVTTGGDWHEFGVTAVAYGIGVAVAAGFLASGFKLPGSRR